MTATCRRVLLAALFGLSALAGCARPVPPPVVVPGSERYPEYPKPDLPADLARQVRPAQLHERAWVQLQAGDPRGSERSLREVLRTAPRFFPSQAALGFARLAQDAEADALQWFDRALAVDAAYVPALIGRAEALVELGREGDAFEAYQSVLERRPDQPVALRRVEILRFRAVQSDVAAAQAALSAKRLEEARDHYGRALKASPESGFLHRDLADVERQLGQGERARTLVDRALALDPQDARAYAIRAEVKEAAGEGESALADYKRALELDRGLTDVAQRITEIETGLKEAALPAEFKAIPATPRVTRGDVAALLAFRLPAVLQEAARGTVLITDSRRHWAQQSILLAARAGAMEVYPNHTFQPASGVTRGEFAAIVNRVLGLLASRLPQAAQGWRDARLAFADVRAGHTLHVAVSRAVASGVLRPLEGQTFGLGRPMSGADAADAVERLARLAEQAGVPAGGAQRGNPLPLISVQTAVLTFANQLTLLRMLLIPVFAILLVYGYLGGALAVFTVAALTDLLDGYFARRSGPTTLGAWLDPVADKLLLLTMFVVLTLPLPHLTHRMPLWLTVVIASRDVGIVLTVAIVNLALGPRTFYPSIWGKLATGTFVATGVVTLCFNWLAIPSVVPDVFFGASALITVISALHYLLTAQRPRTKPVA